MIKATRAAQSSRSGYPCLRQSEPFLEKCLFYYPWNFTENDNLTIFMLISRYYSKSFAIRRRWEAKLGFGCFQSKLKISDYKPERINSVCQIGEPSFRGRIDKWQPLCIPTGYQFLSILPHYIEVDMSIKIETILS